jgi:thiamine-phosphate pyrophosphorylase
MTDCHLYLVSPPQIEPDGFADRLAAALDAGVTAGVPIACLQLRLKEVADEAVVAAGRSLLPICRQFGVALIVNDRADLARTIGADGVHLGQSDGTVAAARRLLGDQADIGVTCHDSRHLAMEAAEAGADYVAFGAFYPSATKETVHRPEPEILSIWSQMTTVPCVAIGGITAANAAPLVRAGADYLAVSSAVWDHPQGAGAGIEAFAAALRDGASGP